MEKGHFIVSEIVSQEEIKRVVEFDLKFDVQIHNLFSDIIPDIEFLVSLDDMLDDDEISELTEELKKASASIPMPQALELEIDAKFLHKVAKDLDIQLCPPKIIFVVYQEKEYILGIYDYPGDFEQEEFLESLIHDLALQMIE